jgi:hypothetical protein
MKGFGKKDAFLVVEGVGEFPILKFSVSNSREPVRSMLGQALDPYLASQNIVGFQASKVIRIYVAGESFNACEVGRMMQPFIGSFRVGEDIYPPSGPVAFPLTATPQDNGAVLWEAEFIYRDFKAVEMAPEPEPGYYKSMEEFIPDEPEVSEKDIYSAFNEEAMIVQEFPRWKWRLIWVFLILGYVLLIADKIWGPLFTIGK